MASKLMIVAAFAVSLTVFGCAARRQLTVDTPTRYATNGAYAYIEKSKGDWVVISKGGPQKAQSDLCGRIVCTTEVVGTMYHIQMGRVK